MTVIKKIRNFGVKLLMFIFYTFFRKNNKVVFTSFNGKSYSDNPKAISEELYKRLPETEIVWLFKNPDVKEDVVPKYIKMVKSNSIKAYIELATATIWVDNFTKPNFLFKGKKQNYIQTWHGDRAFKKILYDVRTKLPDGNYKEGNLLEENDCDLALSGSDYGDRHYRSAFNYKGDILKKGLPRNDKLINVDNDLVRKVKNNLSIDPSLNIFLYAPTLRKESSSQVVEGINLEKVIKTLEDATNEKWIGLVRAHSAVNTLGGISFSNKVIDVSSYEDMNELLLITNLLITDYSSSAGDFALLDRLIILFQNDRKEYEENDRGFYFNIDESPYIIANNQDELENILSDFNSIDKHDNCKKILEFYNTAETGQATKYVVDYINSKIN